MKQLLDRIKILNISSYIEDPQNYRVYVMALFRLLGIFLLMYYTIEDIVAQQFDEAIFSGIIIVFFLISYLFQRYDFSMPWVFRIGIALLVVNFLYIISNSPNPYIPPLWLLIIPLIVAILFDTTEAILWILFTGIVAHFIIQSKGITEQSIQSYYGRIFVVYLIVGGFSIISDYVRGIVQNKYAETQKEIMRVNEKISSQVITDSLTGVYNREFLSTDVPKTIQNAITGNSPLAVIVFDIDQFKSINDELGHLVGDQVLREIAEVSMSLLRRSMDSLVRYGGDEFLVVLEETTLQEASTIAERMRLEIESGFFSDLGVDMTGSFGVTQLLEEDITQNAETALSKLIARADRNLYEAKEMGKNKVVAR